MKLTLNEDHHPAIGVKFKWCPFPLPFLIDTGAKYNYIFTLGNPELETRLNKTGKRIYSVAAGGQELDCPEVFESILIGDLKFDLKFGITKGSFLNFQGILGTKFLYDNNISLHLSQGKFLLKKTSKLDSFYLFCHP